MTLTDVEATSFQNQIARWTTYFAKPTNNAGLEAGLIIDPEELRQLTDFFAWTGWASVANRPDKTHSYTNKFPFDPMVGNILDLRRFWQILLAVGLVFWLGLLIRAVAAAREDPDRNEMASLFMLAAVGIPLFYLPALFFTTTTNYAIVDTWRFWIMHLWVEGFLELFATVMVAILYFLLGIASRQTVTRVIYLDAILFLGSGIIGTGHHWYWTGQSNIAMALGAVFSALEVVPSTLLTLDAWDFMKLTRGKESQMSHRWTFYFLIAVGFWNFFGAGVLGFLINMPIVSYYEIGTMLTPNHGHGALMGVFGMLALGLLTFALRQVLKDKQWAGIEKYIRVGFWGLNIGLLLMVIITLFPGGMLQLVDVLNNGYWHARSAALLADPVIRFIE